MDDAFIDAILAEPRDTALRLVYADWLEERGDPRGEYLRLLTSLNDGSAPGSNSSSQLSELRSRLDPTWVALMEHGRFRPYLNRVRAGFANDGFSLSEGVTFQEQRFTLVANAIRLQKLPPMYFEEFFFFYECDEPHALTAMCPRAWAFALEHRDPNPPWLSYLVGQALLCYVVALCSHAAPDVVEEIQSGFPRWYFAQGGTTPLLYDSSKQELYSFQRRRWLGANLWSAMKDSINQRLRIVQHSS
jgi:uncharacterized protein (TIGR02996 family)